MKLFENYFPPHLLRLFGKGTIAVQMGDVHKQRRSIIVSYLTTSTIQNTLLRHCNEAAKKIFGSWENGSIHSVVTAANQYAYDIILKTALGKDPNEQEAKKLREYTDAVAAAKMVADKTLKQIVEGRRCLQGKKTRERDDFLEWVMKTADLSSEQTADLLTGFFVGGAISTPLAIGGIIYFLQGCPKALEQLREEHLQVGRHKGQDGAAELTWENYKKMNFTQCIINETLRLLPETVMKKATTNIQYKGYETPRGSLFVLNLSGAHFDPSLFENPHVFNPWQWLILRRYLQVLEMKNDESVTDYFSRVLLVCNNINNPGEIMNDSKIVEIKFLHTLPSSWNFVVCYIEASKDIRSLLVNQLGSKLLVHEPKLQKIRKNEDGQVLNVS